MSAPDLGRRDGDEAIDFAFLATQTFDDLDLQREVLALFVAQARRVIPTLARLGPREQGDAAHLLKGSARGIGAWDAAASAADYEAADGAARPGRQASLAAAFARVEAAIAAHPLFGAS